MYSMTHEHNEPVYGLKRFVVDAESDIADLPTINGIIVPGSTAFVIATSATYILNNQRVWIKIQSNSSGSGSDTSDTSTDNTYIWDGGDISS
jgi:hypothetical protein